MLKVAELRYPIIEKEALALFFEIFSFKEYLYDGREFFEFIDDLNLISLMKNRG
jgi:hypothetical protein